MNVLEFRKPKIEEYDDYRKYYHECMQLCSESSFWSIWEMGETMDAQRAFYKGFYWHKVTWHGQQLWMPPIGDWDSVDWEELLTEVVPKGTLFGYMPEYLVKKWMAAFPEKLGNLEPMSGESDYIFHIDRLAELEGGGYSELRRRVKQFISSYGERSLFKAIEPEDIPNIIDFQNQWMEENRKLGKGSEDLEIEHQMALKILSTWPLEGMIGSVLLIDEKTAGYIVVSELDIHSVEGHILKADYSYKGIYQYMQNQLYRQLSKKYVIMNAWGDGDVEGLRKTKLAQNPIVMLNKFLISWQG